MGSYVRSWSSDDDQSVHFRADSVWDESVVPVENLYGRKQTVGYR
jgi:hypothetical protein